MKKVVLLVVALLALVAASSTASASGHVQANADCAELFSPLASLTAGSTGRGPFKEPVLRAGPSDSNIPGRIRLRALRSARGSRPGSTSSPRATARRSRTTKATSTLPPSPRRWTC